MVVCSRGHEILQLTNELIVHNLIDHLAKNDFVHLGGPIFIRIVRIILLDPDPFSFSTIDKYNIEALLYSIRIRVSTMFMTNPI